MFLCFATAADRLLFGAFLIEVGPPALLLDPVLGHSPRRPGVRAARDLDDRSKGFVSAQQVSERFLRGPGCALASLRPDADARSGSLAHRRPARA